MASPLACLCAALLLGPAALVVSQAAPAQAQTQKFMLQRGSKVGTESQVKENCTTVKDGTINCDTKIVNPPGTTEAKPFYSPFKN